MYQIKDKIVEKLSVDSFIDKFKKIVERQNGTISLKQILSNLLPTIVKVNNNIVDIYDEIKDIKLSLKNEEEEIEDVIIDFLIDSKDDLIDHVVEDLKLKNCDSELSYIKDSVTEIKYNVSIEDIIIATRNRIINAIETFKEDK